MQDNMYSFNFRRMQAQYHIYFQDFKSAEEQLRSLLKDELKYYNMYLEKAKEEVPPSDKDAKTEEKGGIKKVEKEEKPFVPVDLEEIDLKILNDEELKQSEEYLYTRKSHPMFKIL